MGEDVLGKHHQGNAGVAEREDDVLDQDPDIVEYRGKHELSFTA